MRYFCLSVSSCLLAVIATAVTFGEVSAQQATSTPMAGAEQPSIFGALMQMLPMLAVCYLIFYFMVIKPQETKNKKHRELMEALKKGDSVITTSGIVGKVAGVESEHVTIEIAQNVKVKFLRSHIARFEVEPQKA